MIMFVLYSQDEDGNSAVHGVSAEVDPLEDWVAKYFEEYELPEFQGFAIETKVMLEGEEYDVLYTDQADTDWWIEPTEVLG